MSLLKAKLPVDLLKSQSAAICYLLLGFVIFYLCVHYSKDWTGYEFWYVRESKVPSWAKLFSQFNPLREPLYKWVAKGIGELIGFSGFVLLATISLLFIKLRFLEKIVGSALVGTFFYVCLYILLFEGTAIRISYAVALIVPALYFLKNQRYVYAFLLIILASQIHLTALIFLIIFPLYFFSRLNGLVYLLFFLSPLLIIFDVSVFALFKQLIAMVNPRYLEYGEAKLVNQNSTGLYLYFITFFAMILMGLYIFLKEKIQTDRFAASIYSTGLSGIIFMCLFHDHVAVGARFGELLLVSLVILLSWLYMHFYQRKMIIYQVGLVSVFMMYFLARAIYLYPTMFA